MKPDTQIGVGIMETMVQINAHPDLILVMKVITMVVAVLVRLMGEVQLDFRPCGYGGFTVDSDGITGTTTRKDFQGMRQTGY